MPRSRGNTRPVLVQWRADGRAGWQLLQRRRRRTHVDLEKGWLGEGGDSESASHGAQRVWSARRSEKQEV